MTCKLQPVSAQAEEDQRAAGEPSTQEAQGREPIEKDLCPQKMAQGNERVRLQKRVPIPPLPSKLPPVNLLHQDIVRAWCQQ